jgi:hypothetical protein
LADQKDEIKIKTKVTTQTAQKGVSGGKVAGGGVPGRKLTPRGNLSPRSEFTPEQKTTPGQKQEQAVPQRQLTPKGELGQEMPTAGQSAAQPGGQPARQTQNQVQPTQKPAEEQKSTTLNKPEPQPGHSLSPGISDADLKNKKGVNIPTSKQDAKDKLAQKAKEPAKRAASEVAKKLARQTAQAIAKLAAQAGAAIIGFFGWWVLAIVAIIVIVVIVISIILYSTAASGYFGKAQPVAAGTISTNSDIKQAIDYSAKPTGVTGYNQLMFLVASDKDYMANSGKIDARLVKALNYLISKHKMVRISHIISDYDLMNTNETGSDTNPQIIANITAHKDGLAADVDEIDFVYEVDLQGTVTYYNDLNQVLLTLPDTTAGIWNVSKVNTIFNGQPAQALPIPILDQDCKPNIKHAGNLPDPCTTITDPTQMLVFQKVYQPEARRKVHQAITELLQWPHDSGNTDYYRITQLITYSYARDVQPFEQNGTLDKLYGLPRPANYGLFYMLESWQNIHIAY